jgi:hypothetical protein
LAKDCPVPPRQQTRRPFNKGPKRFGKKKWSVQMFEKCLLWTQPVHNDN